MTQISQQAIEQYAAAAGPGDTATAAAIAMAESGGDTAAVGDQGTSFGLWQIHLPAHPDVSRACALDPACAARAAREISNGWANFHAWTTFNTGDYRRYLGGGTAVATLGNVQATPSLAGQDVVGTRITSPWLPGTWQVTQGWGPTGYGGEPEGHGYAHWHAGVDVGCESGTPITLPAGLGGRARWLDNPGGYGTALVILLGDGQAVLLGHLRQRLVDDGAVVRAGEQLAATGSTGNSTGPHLHFEVRPQDSKRPGGLAAYGTDVDPSALLLGGASGAQLLSSQGPADAINQAIAGYQLLGAQILAGGQVLLGTGMVLSGLLVTGYGARGRGLAALQRDAVRVVRRAPRRAPARPEPGPPVTGAERTRVRMNLQRQLPPEPPTPRSKPMPRPAGFTEAEWLAVQRSGRLSVRS